ncbi:NAD(P)H-binding protein [Sulfurirhabdus autotrophica]|uniref:Nucleoside-diphosphate-sugar epimerase n=1 Tax=Sulfurirhabdus autotrophica TaxID=1706046 RepID=A0A4R3Y4V9_9PROT|nr:NAD(P)H-binding protein [Sulfurirhabdus autotrophica]TCV85838.1 nucleoside-diphosphate-sugar epimerase [Sulfurirhabdus autotrophica]
MSHHTPSVLIFGANGRFGTMATHAFAKAGWQVRAQVRRTQVSWPKEVEPVQIDAMQVDALCRTAQGMDVIVNALNPPYTQWERFARPLAANALAAAKASGALLMFPGNVYNFGKSLPAELHLDTPQIGNNSKARVRIDIEQQLRAAAASGVNSVVVRAGDFFGGEGRGSWFDLVITKSLGKGKLVYPGPMDVPHTWAYLPDLAETFVRLANLRAHLHGVNCLHFAGHALTGAELHLAMESASGRTLRLTSLPWGIIRLAAPFSPMVRAMLEMRYLWQRPHIMEDSALRAQLGDVPNTPFTQALTEALTALNLPTAHPVPILHGA